VETGAEDETEFGRQTGWVQLQPAIDFVKNFTNHLASPLAPD